jgi:hypothetical protein
MLHTQSTGKMKKNNLLLLFILSLFTLTASAQDSLMALLQSGAAVTNEKTFATFKSTKIISAQSNETIKKRNLDFRVGHLFGNMGEDAGGGGIHTLYGLDQSNDIRISFDYGITDRFMVSVGRNKRQENLSGATKFRLLEQTNDDKIPLAITLFGSAAFSPKADPEGIYTPSDRRWSYCAQAIIARKFSSKFLLSLYHHLFTAT